METTNLRDGWLAGEATACASLAAKMETTALVELATPGLLACAVAINDARPEITEVVRVGGTPSNWGPAHKAFDRVRELTLLAERGRPNDKDPNYLLLFVSENSARVIYNASDPADPFDADSAGWLLCTMSQFLRSLPEPERAAVLDVVDSCFAQ